MLITPPLEPAGPWQRFFSNGFRPLFLVCALQALSIMLIWLLYLGGSVSLSAPTGWGAVAWHGHEMLFGFVGAAVGGFLLAAVAKWTGRRPVHGAPLVLLTALWIAGRLVTWSGVDSLVPLVLANTGYWILLSVLIGREILISGNRRNLVVVLALGIMSLFSLMFQLGWVDRIHLLESMVLLIALMISLIGGRITPAFTRNWLIRRQTSPEQMPAPFGWVDKLAIGSSILATLAWVSQLSSVVSGVLLLLAGCAQILRLLRWRGLASLAEPLLFALHLGYLWVGIGFLLLGLSQFTAIPVTAGIHALGVGAMAGMILAVASRAALGHTNRELRAGTLVSLAFLAIHLAALVRVLAALLPQLSLMLMMLAGTIWLLAFGLFAVRYVPILIGPEESLSEALRRARG
ncbi:NnrS family protein [Marinobacterium sp. D7]|uniref:NnrS family protein n=1 Tax=Marinobacterium ramblicola TaxID=2849041 RepID=UPI001C2DDE2D|nr:NnrS family protein [Marinobacterium ramblicola]MBV1790094.1 NnrS family protein [Marinobacterium ramblicola]